jgi:hypothetical protein
MLLSRLWFNQACRMTREDSLLTAVDLAKVAMVPLHLDKLELLRRSRRLLHRRDTPLAMVQPAPDTALRHLPTEQRLLTHLRLQRTRRRLQATLLPRRRTRQLRPATAQLRRRTLRRHQATARHHQATARRHRATVRLHLVIARRRRATARLLQATARHRRVIPRLLQAIRQRHQVTVLRHRRTILRAMVDLLTRQLRQVIHLHPPRSHLRHRLTALRRRSTLQHLLNIHRPRHSTRRHLLSIPRHRPAMALHRDLGITTIATARPSAADPIYSVVGIVIGCLCLYGSTAY